MNGAHAHQDIAHLQKRLDRITTVLQELLRLVGRDPQDLLDFTRSEKVYDFLNREAPDDHSPA